MLHINNLIYRIGGRTLFDGATLHVPLGHKFGLVGRNGTGKTTLFRLILDEATPDGGTLKLRKGITIGTVAQEAPNGHESLLEHVLAADTERTELLVRAETTTDAHEIAFIHTRLADIDAETAPARAARILAGLGFNEHEQSRPCQEFSGGWRMRVALAATLFATPDLLLLDEPTNHLDLEATLWLESYLTSWQGTLIVISHDRTLLNTVVKEIVHLETLKLTRYNGGYDTFERTRRERHELNAKLRSKQQAQRRHIEAFVKRFRYKASKASQAQSRLKLLEKMAPIASVVEQRTVAFDFPNPNPLSSPLVALDNAEAGYEEQPVLKNLDLRINMDDRIALVGANGNGKTTLIKLLAGQLKPLSGRLVKSSKLKIGYFAQHQGEELIPAETPYQHLAKLMPMTLEAKIRAHLARFGFAGEKAGVKAGDLSGGEKARLLLAMNSTEAPHLLLLDEPTNHLDVDAREALVQALNTYEGAVILVSHDAHMINLVSDQLWNVENGTCIPFDGNLEDYRQQLVEQRRKEPPKNQGKLSTTPGNRKEVRRERAQQRATTAELRKAVQEKEKQMEHLIAERISLESHLADPKVYEGPTKELMELQIRHGEIKAELNKTEEAWLKLGERLEITE